MSECSDITKAIKELSAKIDGFKKEVDDRLSSLENQVANLTRKVNGLDQDIKNIIARVNSYEVRISKLENFYRFGGNNRNNSSNKDLSKIKQQIAAIERYINALDNAGKQITSVVKRFAKIFSIF